MQAIVFAVLSLIFIAALLWLLLPETVVEIPAADPEDRQKGLYCQPETLWEIFAEIDHEKLPIPIDHWQLDAVIRALAKRGHVIMGPCREDIEQAASLLEGRMIP